MTVIKTKVVPPKPTYVKYSEAQPGQTLVLGTFEGSKLVPNFNRDGEVPAHYFNTDDGTVVLNSASDLNKQLQHVDEGDVVEIVFLGAEKLKNQKGQPYKLNKFEVSKLTKE